MTVSPASVNPFLRSPPGRAKRLLDILDGESLHLLPGDAEAIGLGYAEQARGHSPPALTTRGMEVLRLCGRYAIETLVIGPPIRAEFSILVRDEAWEILHLPNAAARDFEAWINGLPVSKAALRSYRVRRLSSSHGEPLNVTRKAVVHLGPYVIGTLA